MGIEVPWTALAMAEAEQAERRRRMNRDNGKTIAGRQLPPGYSLMEDPMRACFHVMGPNGHVGSIERRFAADDISDFADEVVKQCYEDAERRYKEEEMERGRLMEELGRRQREMLDSQLLGAMTGEANMGNQYQQKSPAALARLHREAVRAGRSERGHIGDSFSTLFKQLDENGMIPSRGERFGEPAITSSNKVRIRTELPSSHERRPSAESECREIERKGARAWLLERHNDFVRDVRLP